MTSQDQLYRDPVPIFLALVLADGAFKIITTAEQFLSVRPYSGSKSIQFQ